MVDPVSRTAAANPPGTASKAALDAAELDEDLQYFLNLLVTQLQNQDPLDPLDTNEFTAQLVQFASVEQQIAQNANLERLLTIQENAGIAAMVSYLGTRIEANGNALPLIDGRAEATYTLGESVDQTAVVVRDAAGRTVFTTEGETAIGSHRFVWNGLDGDGNRLADGSYTIDVVATRPDQSFAEATVTVSGEVTGASIENGEVLLFLGDIALPVADVLSVHRTAKAAADPGTGP